MIPLVPCSYELTHASSTSSWREQAESYPYKQYQGQAEMADLGSLTNLAGDKAPSGASAGGALAEKAEAGETRKVNHCMPKAGWEVIEGKLKTGQP